MKVVSIMNGHNATVGLFEEGRAVRIVHEEKFNNIKNYVGFPHSALDFVLQMEDPANIDYFVFTSKEQIFVGVPTERKNPVEALSQDSFFRNVYSRLEYKIPLKKAYAGIRDYAITRLVSPKAKGEIEAYLYKRYKIPRKKIRYVDHHTNHYLSPFFFYNLSAKEKDFLLFTLDGAGDNLCSRVVHYRYNEDMFEEVSQSYYDTSIGLLYSEATKFLGMKPNEHEYKVMGLAAYVSNEKYYKPVYDKLKKIIWLDKGALSFRSAFNMNVAFEYLKENFVGERFDNIAAALQRVTEELVTEWVRETILRTGAHSIACSGGVFMNVKMNQKIMELPEVEEVYFQPTSSDESLVIGAAAKVFMDNGVPLKAIETMFLGLNYTNKDVETFLRLNGYDRKYKVTYFEDIENKTADLVSKFNIVARFKGFGEWGARSLCDRCILGNARDLKTFYEVNDMIKMRDFWMPFAPVILDSWCPKYIENWDVVKRKAFDSTKYMILTFESTQLAQEHLRAAIHQKDKTLRPQIVEEKDNPSFYRFLKYYEERTGMGGLLNTSLNMHGYPLVGSLEQAMFTFENSGLKYMSLENYLLEKKS